MRPYRDRAAAGEVLAAAVAELAPADPLVLALPRGGVPVAVPVAKALGAGLDVLVVRKIGLPQQPELGIGAIAENGASVLDEDMLRRFRIDSSTLDGVIARERAELERRVAAYRRRPPPRLAGHTVVLVDDGLARGVSARAAVAAVQEAAQVWLAVPVGSRPGLAAMACDQVICPWRPASFGSVGQYYRDFAEVGDDEVRSLLG
ncbi:phosphoribosyltransferase [Fodinicola acaciae]|uniref:phosphoribosyltransferase n=1 Tax=Fodinicola acaciae TaxID=2681555 RepID=UPI0013D51A38|nr:phosphoribosyltransferase family protein [Fodinicola acaciae]